MARKITLMRRRERRAAHKLILRELKKLGIEFIGMKMRTAAEKVAVAHGVPFNSPVGKGEVFGIARRLAEKLGISYPEKSKPFIRRNLAAVGSQSIENLDDKINAFYASWDWKRLRYDFIKDKKRKCACCGSTPEDGIRIVVDHIKPIRHYWHLRLGSNNLQMLCDDCNMGKGSRDETDWRGVTNPDVVVRLDEVRKQLTPRE